MDKRIAARHRVLKVGTIEFGASVITCGVRNMSDTGAMLDVATPVGIPEHFILFVRAEGHRVPCHLVWRKERRIGIAFE
jgi:PilZ domain-containing protein